LSIDFQKDFHYRRNGAGKSIILGIRSCFGKRADLTLKNKEEKCIIEAHFEISKYNLFLF
jgi:DNA repair protein RecN (Recombination protein N)